MEHVVIENEEGNIPPRFFYSYFSITSLELMICKMREKKLYSSKRVYEEKQHASLCYVDWLIFLLLRPDLFVFNKYREKKIPELSSLHAQLIMIFLKNKMDEYSPLHGHQDWILKASTSRWDERLPWSDPSYVISLLHYYISLNYKVRNRAGQWWKFLKNFDP